MNKFLKSLIIAAFCVGAFSALSASSTKSSTCDFNKTFMNPRSHGTNLALLHGPGICEIINRVDKDKFGGTLQAVVFGEFTDHDAEYWTPLNKNGFDFTAEGLEHFAKLHTLPAGGGVAASAMVFPVLTDKDKISFDPEQDAYGVTLAYDQRLDSLLKGLYFRVQLPIVHVQNDLNMKIEGDAKEGMVKYFKGESTGKDFSANTTVKSLDNLTYAKIDGDDSETGIADIDVLLGYTFLNKDDYHASLNIGITIPTGTDADGKIFNQAIVGNGQHFGLGAGVTFDARLWGDKEHNIMLYLELKYRYLFESSEHRTMGLKDMPWGYFLPITKAVGLPAVALNAQVLAGLDFLPAANVTTLNVDVTPGSEFDGIVTLAYNNGGFGANLGYNVYFREGEDVDLKDTNPFEKGDEYYYISGSALAPLATTATLTALKKTDLIKNVSETCSQTTHKIFGGIAWTFKDWETPVNVGLGAHYEFADGRRANQGWGINGRAAIGF